MNSYDAVAPFYDLLSRLVYGKKLLHAQQYFLKEIPDGSRVLFLGGGTGKVLPQLLQIPGISVDYVEPSAAMLHRAMKRLSGQTKQSVQFIPSDHTQLPANVQYDAVLTFFVLDMFTELKAAEFTDIVNASLKPGALWLLADFFPPRNILYRALLKVMYLFFHFTTGIQTWQLPDYDKVLNRHGFHCNAEKKFMEGFIRSCVYKR